MQRDFPTQGAFLHVSSLAVMSPVSEWENPKELTTRQEREYALKAASGYSKKKKERNLNLRISVNTTR